MQLTIGKIAAQAGVNVETVRYYERRGLLPEPPRTESGYRLYGPESVTRLRFIKRAQELGFTLHEIADLLALRVDAETTCEDVRRRAERKVAEIHHKISALQSIQTALETMIASCQRDGPQGECPFLETIEQQAKERIAG